MKSGHPSCAPEPVIAWNAVMPRLRGGKAAALILRLAAAGFATLLGACSHSPHLSFLDPQGPVASIQRTHFIEMLALLSIFVALPIFVLIPWFAWRYRYGARSSRYTPRWKFFRPLEIAAWSGPSVIVVLLGILVWRSTHALDPYKPLQSSQPALHVQVIGYDWKWLFIYPDQGVASVGMLAIPAGRPVAMQLTSATVMQSLQIPALGSQIYAMGGMVTRLNLQADKPGEFMGKNTMYNGTGFHRQQFRTVAMTTADFNTWVDGARTRGHSLDAAALKALAQRTTAAQLIDTLDNGKQHKRSMSFSGASAQLFPAVVRATMAGSAPDLQHPAQAAASRPVLSAEIPVAKGTP